MLRRGAPPLDRLCPGGGHRPRHDQLRRGRGCLGPRLAGRSRCGCLRNRPEEETDEGRYTDALVPSVVARRGRQTLVGGKRQAGQPRELGLGPIGISSSARRTISGSDAHCYRAPDGFRTAAEIGGPCLAFLQRAARADGACGHAPWSPCPPRSSRPSGTRWRRSLPHGVGGRRPPRRTHRRLLNAGPHGRGRSLPKRRPCQPRRRGHFGGALRACRRRLAVASGEGVDVAPLAMSRYHRLGGGDIDVAVVQVLLPALLTQNNLAPLDLDPDDKLPRRPCPVGRLRSLKIAMCREDARAAKLGRSARMRGSSFSRSRSSSACCGTAAPYELSTRPSPPPSSRRCCGPSSTAITFHPPRNT